MPIRNQTQHAMPNNFTDRNRQNTNNFFQDQGMPQINNFDQVKNNQIIQNQNIMPMRNVPKGMINFIKFLPKNIFIFKKFYLNFFSKN